MAGRASQGAAAGRWIRSSSRRVWSTSVGGDRLREHQLRCRTAVHDHRRRSQCTASSHDRSSDIHLPKTPSCPHRPCRLARSHGTWAHAGSQRVHAGMRHRLPGVGRRLGTNPGDVLFMTFDELAAGAPAPDTVARRRAAYAESRAYLEAHAIRVSVLDRLATP